MPKRRRYDLRKRHFLNPLPTGYDSYIAIVFESCEEGAFPMIENTVTIADCHRVVHLEFYMGSPEARRASLWKMDGLLDTIATARTMLYKQNEMIEKARKDKRRKRDK